MLNIIIIILRTFKECIIVFPQVLNRAFQNIFIDIYASINASIRRCKLYILVLQTKKIKSSQESSIEVASLVSRADLPLYLVAIKTFSFFIDVPISICIYNDGSLSQIDKKLIHRFIEGVTVIDTDKMDDFINRKLNNTNYSSFRRNMPLLKKTIDIPLLSNKKKIIILDSDVIFFACPHDILDWVQSKENTCFFIEDIQNSFIISQTEAKYLYRKKLVPKFNSGLIGFSKKIVDFRFITYFLANIEELSPKRHYPWIEQTILSLLFGTQIKRNIFRLPKSYCISSDTGHIHNLICRHYVWPSKGVFSNDARVVLSRIKFQEKSKKTYENSFC